MNELFAPRPITDTRIVYDRGIERKLHANGVAEDKNLLLSSIADTFYLTDTSSNAIYCSKSRDRVVRHAETNLKIKWL